MGKRRVLIAAMSFMLLNVAVYAATSASVSFNYNSYNGTLNKTKLLNLARGYQGPINNLAWHNSFYGNMTTTGIQELRMDWIPSDSTYHVISRNASNQLVYDFTRLDTILLPLLRRGMRPVLCMHMENIAALGITQGFPTNLTDYQAVITAFVQHYKDLGYTGLTWESHNEPEYFTAMTPEQTYRMYDIFSPAVKAVDPTAVVGGYGSGPDKFTYIGSFLDYYKNDATKPPMDYFSYHQYGSETFDSYLQVENLFTSRGLTVPPFYLTEWNDYPFEQTDNDDSHHAPWVSKKMYWALMHAPRLAKIYFFNYADGDTSKVFSKANGLFTAGNHKKAAANTYNLYNNLHSAMLTPTISGTDTSTYNVYAVATKDPASGAVSLILWNDRSTDVNVSLQLSNLPYLSSLQNFVLTKYIIDGTHGNYYNDFLNNGALPGDTAVGQSENVGVSEITTLSPAASLSRNEYLPAWSVTQIKLDPVSVFNPASDYEIVNCSSGLVMQINALNKAEQGSYAAGGSRKWNLVDLGGGWYKIVNKSSGLALEIPGGSTSNGMQLAQAAWSGANHQQWQIVNAGSYYKILNRTSGLAANVSGSSQTEGVAVIQSTSGAGLNMLWKIQPARPAPNETCRAHWKLNETAGIAAVDNTGYANHGLLQGTNFGVSSIVGKDVRALNLDGIDDHVTVPAMNLYSNAVTMTAWIKRDPACAAWSGIIFNRTPNANGLNIGNGTELRYHWNNTMYEWDSGLSVPANVWTFVALVIGPDRATIYMDSGSGMQSATNLAAHQTESFGGDSYIGYDPAISTRHFKGAIDDVRIYNASLTSVQVAAVRNAVDIVPPTPNPMTWATVPYESGTGQVTMNASAASDPAGVEYYFDCVSGGGHDSGWQSSPAYTDTGLFSVTAEYRVKARDASPQHNETGYSASAAVTIAPYPYGGQIRAIPGVLQAEEFDVAGQGLSYYDTTAGNSGGSSVLRPNEDVDIVSVTDGTAGYAVNDIQTGEWLLYTVNSTAIQTNIYARVASTQAGSQIKVWLDDTLLGTMDVPNTGSLTAWQAASIANVQLPDRQNAKLKLEFIGSNFRVNMIEFRNRTPYFGTPLPIPGEIEFENYDIGGKYITYYDTSNGNIWGVYRNDDVDLYPFGTDQYAVYAESNEWLEYTVDLLAGVYDLSIRTSSTYNNQVLTLTLDGQALTTFNLPKRSGWTDWQETSAAVTIASGGQRVLRATVNSAVINLDRIRFVRRYNPSDIDRNTQVDAADFAVLSSQWQTVPASPSADIAPAGGDGQIDLLDLLALADEWLKAE